MFYLCKMKNIYVVPDDLLFSPAVCSGDFWSQMSSLLLYLAAPNELVKIYEESPEDYFKLIEPFQRFISVTENELKEKGLLVEKELEES